MKILRTLTDSLTHSSIQLTLSATSSITHTLTRRTAISAALILSAGLGACGDSTSTTDFSETEALISASDLTAEDLDLQTLALSATGEEEMGQVCSPQRIRSRGRSHHAQRQGNTDDQTQAEINENLEEGQAQRGRSHQRRKRRHLRRGLIMMAYDLDGDKKLSDQEREALTHDLVAGCEAQHERLLEQFDADESGDLDEDELSLAREALAAHREARQDLRQASREERRALALEEFDADDDGELNRAERRTAHEAARARHRARIMAEFDVDRDGELNDEELETLSMTVRARVQSGQRAEPEQEED